MRRASWNSQEAQFSQPGDPQASTNRPWATANARTGRHRATHPAAPAPISALKPKGLGFWRSGTYKLSRLRQRGFDLVHILAATPGKIWLPAAFAANNGRDGLNDLAGLNLRLVFLVDRC